MKHYRFNPRKFLFNVVAPMQFTIGILLILGAAGSSDAGLMDWPGCFLMCLIGALLILSTAIYQRKYGRRIKR
jgi:hypothetical protein